MKTLLLDVDGCIADCASVIHSIATTGFGREIPHPDTWQSFDFAESMQLSEREAETFFQYMEHSRDPHDIQFYPGAADAVHALKERFDVVAVTAHWRGCPAWVVARDKLLEPLGIDIVHTHAKHRVRGDILVDDRAATIIAGGPWQGVLFSRPCNASAAVPHRVGSLLEILRFA